MTKQLLINGCTFKSKLGSIFIVLIAGLFVANLWAASPANSKKLQKAKSLESEKVLYDANAAILAANRDFPKFLETAWPMKKDSGFKEADEQNDVSLAKPIFVYGIDQEIVGKLKNTKNLSKAVKPVGEWIFPVQANGKYRTLFGVRLMGNNKWRGAYLGNPYLAASLEKLRKSWSSEKGDDFKLVSCTLPRGFFFIATNVGKPNLTPITRVAIGEEKYIVPPVDWKSVRDADDTLNSLKDYWKTQLPNEDGIPADTVGRQKPAKKDNKK